MENLWRIYGYGWWLVSTPLKNMSSSIGMIIYFQLNGKIKVMFQTTKQLSFTTRLQQVVRRTKGGGGSLQCGIYMSVVVSTAK